MLACFLCIVIVAENLRNQLKQHSAPAAVESNSHLAFYYAMVIANFPALYPVMFLYEFSINYNVVEFIFITLFFNWIQACKFCVKVLHHALELILNGIWAV